MKTIILIILLVSNALSLPEEFDKTKYKLGEKIFEAKCNKCHVKYMDIPLLLKNFIEEENKLLNLKAPTANQISFRLKQQIGNKNDIEFHLIETADFVKEYLHNPDKTKSICLKGVVRHFETMPSMKGKISEEEIEDVAFFLYFLEGFNGVNIYFYKEDEF